MPVAKTNVSGSIQNKGGNLYAVIRYIGHGGKRKQKWIATGLKEKGNKQKAKKILSAEVDRYRLLQDYLEGKDCTVSYLSKQWLKSEKRRVNRAPERKDDTIRLTTYEKYEHIVNHHILPFFDKLNLSVIDVKPKHIKQYYDICRKPKRDGGYGLSVNSVREDKHVLESVFSLAVLMEFIPSNPVNEVTLAKRAKKFVGDFYTGEELIYLLEHSKGDPMYEALVLTIYYGLRRSEVAGLKWSAVDFKNNEVRIDHTRVRVYSNINIDSTKSQTSKRVYPLIPDVKDALIRLRVRQDRDRARFAGTYQETDYVFRWQDGRPFGVCYYSHHFPVLLKSIGMRKIRFHDLRHSCASFLYEKGWNVKDIQDWLGHADISVTANIYTHIEEKHKQKKGMELTGLVEEIGGA